MSQIKAYVVLVTLLAAAGCASSPEVANEAPVAATPVAATPAAAATEAPGTVVPARVVDVNELVASQAPPVICREILKRGSNVHINMCGTAEEWRRYTRREADDAAAMTRMMQGGRYR